MHVSQRLTFVVSALAGQACMPAVTHAPRIEPGLAMGLTASYTAGPEYENGDDGPSRFAYGPVGVNFGYGWTSARIEGLGASIGAHVPVPLIALIQPDVYVQFPKRALLGLDGGVGLTSVRIDRSVTPYAQLGILRSNSTGAYATYGLLRARNDPDRNHPVLREEGRIAGLAFQWRQGKNTSRIFATGQFGRRFWRCSISSSDACRSEKRWAVATGTAVELRRR
jgi:hypothetical protein